MRRRIAHGKRDARRPTARAERGAIAATSERARLTTDARETARRDRPEGRSLS
jgi:hypothetical protein